MQHTVENLDGTYTDSFGSLKYKLYVSSELRKHPPLFVMLHGATQSASDFASGTRMHEVVEECGGVTLFPEQSRSAHPQACWNWYETKHQFAEQGEPGLLAGLTRQVIEDYGIDRRRVYVAGMSAGGAMAVILGQAYPELFAAVGVHSGLPTGIATDLWSALKAMSSGPPADAESATEYRDGQRRGYSPDAFPGWALSDVDEACTSGRTTRCGTLDGPWKRTRVDRGQPIWQLHRQVRAQCVAGNAPLLPEAKSRQSPRKERCVTHRSGYRRRSLADASAGAGPLLVLTEGLLVYLMPPQRE